VSPEFDERIRAIAARDGLMLVEVLEKALDANKLENLVLIQKIENNKKSQDSVKLAGEQIKRIMELHKERQRKVN